MMETARVMMAVLQSVFLRKDTLAMMEVESHAHQFVVMDFSSTVKVVKMEISLMKMDALAHARLKRATISSKLITTTSL